MWAIPSIRFNYKQLLDSGNKGPQEYASMIQTITSFFTQASETKSADVAVYSPCDIRRELFKSTYIYENFELFGKADAFEAMDKILTIIHHWVCVQNPLTPSKPG